MVHDLGSSLSSLLGYGFTRQNKKPPSQVNLDGGWVHAFSAAQLSRMSVRLLFILLFLGFVDDVLHDVLQRRSKFDNKKTRLWAGLLVCLCSASEKAKRPLG